MLENFSKVLGVPEGKKCYKIRSIKNNNTYAEFLPFRNN